MAKHRFIHVFIAPNSNLKKLFKPLRRLTKYQMNTLNLLPKNRWVITLQNRHQFNVYEKIFKLRNPHAGYCYRIGPADQ